MNAIRNALTAACCLCLALSAGAADRREARDVPSFHAVGIAAPIKVEITQSDKDGVVVEGDTAALAELETVVENGSLQLRQRSRERVPGMNKVKAYVSLRSVDSIAISGSGEVSSATLRADTLHLAISGSGDMRIGQVTATRLDVAVSGSGDVSIAGKADTMDGSIAGSGKLKAARLEAGKAHISIAGSGDATLWARTSLAAHIAGSGDLHYYGDPSVRSSVAGSGRIKRLGATPS